MGWMTGRRQGWRRRGGLGDGKGGGAVVVRAVARVVATWWLLGLWYIFCYEMFDRGTLSFRLIQER
jgi:hypothetical protein